MNIRIICKKIMCEYEIVKLRSGRIPKNLFCLLGTDLYKPLADELDVDINVYGIYIEEVNGVDDISQLYEGKIDYVERMNDYTDAYLNIIKTIQPNGRFYICGFSFGGYVAIELARKIVNNGFSVSVLSLIDSRYLPREKSLTLIDKLSGHFEMMKEYGFKKTLLEKIKNRFFIKNKDNFSKTNDVHKARMFLRTKIEMNYYPDTYTGYVHLFKADRTDPYTKRSYDNYLGWKRILPNIKIHNVYGDHLTLLQYPGVKTISKTLSELILER